MPQRLINRATGEHEFVEDADLDAALKSGKYIAPDAVAVHTLGDDTYATPDQLARDSAYTQAIDPSRVAAAKGHEIRKQANTGIVAGAKAAIGGAVDSATLGAINPFQDEQEFNRGLSTIGQVGGALAPGLLGDEAGLAALMNDPLEAEHAAASLGSKYTYAGEATDAAGSARRLEGGLTKATKQIDTAKAAAAVPEDLAALDAKGLKAARQAELANLETARIPQREALVEDLAAHASALKNDDKIFLATKGIKESELPAGAEKGALKIQEIGAISVAPDRAIQKLLRNPKLLAEEPKRALGLLQQQEHAFEQLGKREGTLRKLFEADTSGERAAALDKLPAALERNRALQGRIRELVAEPASERLAAIDGAKDMISAGGPPKSMLENMLGGSIMGHVAGAFAGLPVIGPMIGAKAGQLGADLVFGRLGKATAEAGTRAGEAVKSFLAVGKRAAPIAAPVIASKVLHAARFAPSSSSSRKPAKEKTTAPELAQSFKARSAEIRSQTAPGPDGKAMMRTPARMAMAERLAPIRAVSPLLADRIETTKARGLEFLADKLPRYPDVAGVQVGPDTRQPSDIQMRTWARYVAAVEDPHGVIERLAHGSISPEDVEALKAVYPGLHADITQKIVEQLPTLRSKLPYQRRLALSIFSGVAVDPVLDPRVLAALQGTFADEEGSEGGTQAPVAQPAFGSVSKPEPTPAQQRGA